MEAHHYGAMPGLATSDLATHDVVDLAPLGTGAARVLVIRTKDTAPDAAIARGPVQTHAQSWGMAHEVRDLAAVAGFLDQVGCSHA
jgi:hypothetical protein